MRTSVFAITLIFLCSCSNVPKPTSFWITPQHKMQAAHHWDVIAYDVAKEVKLSLQEEEKNDPTLRGKQIYVEPHKASLFGEVFGTLLETRLFKLFKHKTKLTENESNSLKLTYDTQMVKHRAERFTSPLYPGAILSLTGLGYGVYKAFSANSDALGLFAAAGAAEIINDIEFEWGVPHYEIVITTKLTKPNGTVIHRRSNIYYINDADFWHYAETEKELPTKKYTCVSE